jgi:hypothetical protein
MLFQVDCDHMNGVPAALLDCSCCRSNLFLDKEATSESRMICIKEVDRGEGVSLVKVHIRVPHKDLIHLCLQLKQFA